MAFQFLAVQEHCMSSEAADLTVSMRKSHINSTKYWAFFTKDAVAFWNFVDRDQEDLKTQGSLSQEAEQAQHILPATEGTAKRHTPFSTTLGENCILKHS